MYSGKSLLLSREDGFSKVINGKCPLIDIQRLVQENMVFFCKFSAFPHTITSLQSVSENILKYIHRESKRHLENRFPPLTMPNLLNE